MQHGGQCVGCPRAGLAPLPLPAGVLSTFPPCINIFPRVFLSVRLCPRPQRRVTKARGPSSFAKRSGVSLYIIIRIPGRVLVLMTAVESMREMIRQNFLKHVYNVIRGNFVMHNLISFSLRWQTFKGFYYVCL